MITTVNSIDTSWSLFAIALLIALLLLTGVSVLLFKYFTTDKQKHYKEVANKLLHYLRQNKI